MIRQPAFAGHFYPDDPLTLGAMLDSFYHSKNGPAEHFSREPAPPLLGVVSPHAGYQYSGQVAAWSFGALAGTQVETYVVLGPNHRGGRARVALSGADSWETPLGRVAVDREATDLLVSHHTLCAIDDRAHAEEHSIEVQIPFLQHFLPHEDWKIVPISLRDQGLELALKLALLLTNLAREKPIAIIASSDFTHYEPEQAARAKDLPLIELITSLQIDELYHYLAKHRVTVCGPGSLAVLAGIQKNLTGIPGRTLLYSTSGEVSGDFHRVVGYASIVFPRGAPGKR